MNDDLTFTKMHGIGNDYIFVQTGKHFPRDAADLARRLSPRHSAVGSDGLILIMPSDKAAVRMRIFNADGSEAEMCGNGLRCVAKYVVDRGLVSTSVFTIETAAGIIPVEVLKTAGRTSTVAVTLPEPVFDPASIPLVSPQPFVDHQVNTPIAGFETVACTTVNVGNPHCVLFPEIDITDIPLAALGPFLENAACFPRRINVEIVNVVNPARIRVRVWERGSGETQACGSGACAAVVAGVITGRVSHECVVGLTGGEVSVTWLRGAGIVLRGPAEEVYRGVIPAAFLEEE